LTPAAAESLRRPLRRLRDGTGDDIDATTVLNVLTSLWCGSEGRTRARPSARMRDAAMRRCLAALSDTVLSLPDAPDLRVIAGVSDRTLEYAFRERFGIGPAAFLKLHRLGRLRAELLRAEPGSAQVGDLAAHHGFWHAGHLSSDYRRIFGETPRQTLMRL
jgi:transcriptional regulator GlxA family with amidase domain